MIVAIMQPYFFPYIGYFQLMHAVDTFVFFDDVQYIERGWVNRNQIPLNGRPTWLTLPVANASRNLPINARTYLLENGVAAIKRKLQAAYAGIANPEGLRAIETLLDFPDSNVAAFNSHLLREVASWLDIGCHLVNASEVLPPAPELRGQERVIALCRALGADRYINAIGGMGLYEQPAFEAAGIRLSFLRTTAPASRATDTPMHFSIIDSLLRNGTHACRDSLDAHEVMDAAQARGSCA